MRTFTVIPVVCLAVVIALAWQPSPTSGEVPIAGLNQKEQAKKGNSGASETYSTKDLPCFKCHIYERFVQEPGPGVFSHALHVQFEYHCNQCHSFRGHRQMVINTGVCTFCHESVPELTKR